MRSSYEPYPIYDLKSGLQLDKEPWLLPQDAFTTLFNWYLYQGVLQKRHGYTEFARFLNIAPSAFGSGLFGEGRFGEGRGEVSYPGNPIMGIYNFYYGIASQLLIWDTRRLNKYNTVTGTCDDMTSLQIQFKTGVKEILAGDTVTGATSGDTAVVDAVILDDGTWVGGDAHGTLVLSGANENEFEEDGEILTVGGTTVATAKGRTSYNDLTGDDDDFIWFENWRDIAYYTNGIDQIRKYNGAHASRLTIDLDVEGGPDNDVNTCLLIFHIKNRILLLRTTERGEAHYQRARWSNVTARGEAVVFSDEDYSDADRDDWITGADFIGNELIIFFERGAMKFVYTGDPDVPFKWENIPAQEGCYATMSLSPFSDEIVAVGPTRLVATDGREVYGVDEKIPDFMLEWNQDYLNYCYSIVIEETRQSLTSYAGAGSDRPNRILALNYMENNYAVYGLPVHVMGYSSLESTMALDDMTGISLDDLDYSLDDKELRAGYPTTLMGCRTGYIYKMNDGGADDGEDIECNAVGARWNPYQKEQRKAVLGHIDFLVDRNANASFDVRFYINTESASYKTETVYCTETGNLRDMVIKRVYSGAEGDFHRISLYQNDSGNRPRIHCITPWFRRGGPLYG